MCNKTVFVQIVVNIYIYIYKTNLVTILELSGHLFKVFESQMGKLLCDYIFNTKLVFHRLEHISV